MKAYCVWEHNGNDTLLYEESELAAGNWKSGEIFMYYHDWIFRKNEEKIFDCNSSGIPHKHCMDVIIAEKI